MIRASFAELERRLRFEAALALKHGLVGQVYRWAAQVIDDELARLRRDVVAAPSTVSRSAAPPAPESVPPTVPTGIDPEAARRLRASTMRGQA